MRPRPFLHNYIRPLTSCLLKQDLVIESQSQLWHARQLHLHLHRPHNLTQQHLTRLAHLRTHTERRQHCINSNTVSFLSHTTLSPFFPTIPFKHEGPILLQYTKELIHHSFPFLLSPLITKAQALYSSTQRAVTRIAHLTPYTMCSTCTCLKLATIIYCTQLQ